MDAETARKYNERLVGLKASCGITVNSISAHAMSRLVERGIPEEIAADVIENSYIIYPGNTSGTICQQKDSIRVVFNQKTGNVVSVIELDEMG